MSTPVTWAPIRSSHSDSQPPLKPVWPVTSTRLPAKALPKSTDSRRSDMEHGRRMRLGEPRFARKLHPGRGALARQPLQVVPIEEIGRASCRERVGQYVSISVVAVSLKHKQI